MEEHQQTFDKKYTTRALLIMSGFIIMVLYIETMLVASLPSIAKQFSVDPAEVSLVLSLYLVSGVALNPVVGKLADIYGKKRMLKYLLPIYVIAVGVTGFSPNFIFMLVSRTIQGVGLTIFPLLISLVQEEFPREMVPRSIAIIVSMFGIGSALGLPLGSLISNSYGWQTTYHTALPVVIIVVALMLLYLRESRYVRPDAKVDYIGAVTLAIALATFVFVLSEGFAFGWESALILTLLAIGIVSAAVLYLYERRVQEPVVSMKLLGIKNVMNANLITFIVGLAFFFVYQSFAYLFESPAPLGFGFNIFQAGLAIVPFSLANIIVAPLAGQMIPKVGVKPFFMAGAVLGIIGFLVSSMNGGFYLAVIGEAIIGFGVAFINVPTVNLLVLSIDRREMGIATALNSVFRFMGSAIGAPLAGIFIVEFASKAAFQYSFYFAAVLIFFVIVISLRTDEILGHKKKLEEEVSV
ncbi:MAG: MFS transporter [Candidatus Micrarchaeota archaeon]|nr:MFS transporter [Candidatus Micrarchaeota archaeon]